jgi:hypothetical protein
MIRNWPIKRVGLILFSLMLAGLGWDYFHSLTVINASISAIVADPQVIGRREIRVRVLSDYPAWPLVPDGMRRFFRLAPTLCFVNPDGSELVNDDIQSPCVPEENAGEKRGKLHAMEQSTFAIPLYLHATPYNGKRLFFRQLQQQHGLWLRFRLAGSFVAPSVEAAPVFVDLAAYCHAHQEQCAGLL